MSHILPHPSRSQSLCLFFFYIRGYLGISKGPSSSRPRSMSRHTKQEVQGHRSSETSVKPSPPRPSLYLSKTHPESSPGAFWSLLGLTWSDLAHLWLCDIVTSANWLDPGRQLISRAVGVHENAPTDEKRSPKARDFARSPRPTLHTRRPT